MSSKNANNGLKKGMGIHARRVLAYVVLIIMTFLCLFWFYVLFINATRSNSEIQRGFSAIPGSRLAANWRSLMNDSLPFVHGMINSLIVAALTALCAVYFSAMTAYSIHAYEYKGRKAIYTFILAVMMIPSQVTILGFVDLIRGMNLMNNFLPLIITSVASPAVFFFMKQYMDSSLPLALIEAARIDGSGEFRTFNQIVLPIMKPAIAVQAIFSFVSSWNNYFVPVQILQKNDMKTLPILIAQLRAADWKKFDMGEVYMAIAFSIFPVVVVSLILSKYIVGGVAAGSVKG